MIIDCKDFIFLDTQIDLISQRVMPLYQFFIIDYDGCWLLRVLFSLFRTDLLNFRLAQIPSQCNQLTNALLNSFPWQVDRLAAVIAQFADIQSLGIILQPVV